MCSKLTACRHQWLAILSIRRLRAAGIPVQPSIKCSAAHHFCLLQSKTTNKYSKNSLALLASCVKHDGLSRDARTWPYAIRARRGAGSCCGSLQASVPGAKPSCCGACFPGCNYLRPLHSWPWEYAMVAFDTMHATVCQPGSQAHCVDA